MLAWWRCTITIPTPMATWPLPLTSTQSTSTRTPECMCVVSFLCQRIAIHAHAPHGSSRESCVHLSSHPHALRKWATLFRLWSPLLPHAPPVAILPLLPALEARRQPAAHSAQREYGLVWRDLPQHIHCVRSVRKVLLRKRRRISCLEKNQPSEQIEVFLSQWTGCDIQGEGCGERMEKGEWVTGLEFERFVCFFGVGFLLLFWTCCSFFGLRVFSRFDCTLFLYVRRSKPLLEFWGWEV